MQLGLGIGLGFNSGARRSMKPNPTKYLFIDGAFFVSCIDELGSLVDRSFQDLEWHTITAGFDRIIYFDALPVKKDGQTEDAFQIVLDQKLVFLNKLRRRDSFHVRDGLTRLRSRGKSPLEQKGVDTWIAVECLQYALRNIIDEAVVVTSDLDLYPLFEALQQTNTKGSLWYQGGRTADELIFSADRAMEITLSKFNEWLKHDRKLASPSIPFRRSMLRESILVGSVESEQGEIDIWFHFDSASFIADVKKIDNIRISQLGWEIIDFVKGMGTKIDYSYIEKMNEAKSNGK